MESESESPFRQNELVQIRSVSPAFEPLGAGETSLFGFKAVRGDFRGLLTSNPRPGDMIVAYATGLGPVLGPVHTGQPAPLDRAEGIQGQFRCRFNPYGDYAETLFAGLAPGMTGIYRVNLRLPPGPDPGPITGGECTWSGSGIEGVSLLLCREIDDTAGLKQEVGLVMARGLELRTWGKLPGGATQQAKTMDELRRTAVHSSFGMTRTLTLYECSEFWDTTCSTHVDFSLVEKPPEARSDVPTPFKSRTESVPLPSACSN